MAGDVAERAPKGGKKGHRRPKRRIAIRIDMTPMVDIAFLLLIFYMVSTVFAMPQAMEINLPPKLEDEVPPIELAESDVLTLRVDDQSRFWWNIKRVTPENLPNLLPGLKNRPVGAGYALDTDTLRNLLVGLNRENSKLNTLILIHPKGNYADMIDILDEIDVIQRGWNDQIAKQKNKPVEDLIPSEKFSYRYAIVDWDELENKVISEAVLAAQAKGQL